MATLDAATVYLKIAAHNKLQATGVTAVDAYPFAVSAGDIIPPTVDLGYKDISAGVYTATGGAFKATISGLVADGVNADSLNANGALAISASFKGANLANASFKGATIAGSKFDLANLAQADFTGAGATGATSFIDADIRNAKLKGIVLGSSVTPFG